MLAKKFALGFGIAIILPMIIYYGVSTFISPAPRWEDYHDNSYYERYQNASPEEKAEIDQQIQDREKVWRQKEGAFQRNLFFIAIPVGIVSIIIGAILPIQAIGTGFMFGGIFSLTEGYMFYWSELQDYTKFLSLLIAFTVLVFIGYRKLTK